MERQTLNNVVFIKLDGVMNLIFFKKFNAKSE
jgi:hypothetical protein